MVYDTDAETVAVADGVVTTGGVLTLNATLGNGISVGVNLDGADGFRYDVSSDGTLDSGGTVDRQLRYAYSGADSMQVNGLEFPNLDAARPDAARRELTFGPVPMPDVVATRRVFVPQAGGFVRYLETLTNPTAVPQTIDHVDYQLHRQRGPQSSGRAGDDRKYVHRDRLPESATATRQRSLACSRGRATPALSVSTITTRDDYFSFTYRVTLLPGATVTFMHFEVQRGGSDAAGAEAQARALVDLTDPNVLTGMSDAERAQVVNFVIPR